LADKQTHQERAMTAIRLKNFGVKNRNYLIEWSSNFDNRKRPRVCENHFAFVDIGIVVSNWPGNPPALT